MNRQQWLKERQQGIGASDAACVLGLSPYKTNVRLWEEKTGRVQAEDISDKSYVQYGIQAERMLRELFELDFPQYEVSYEEFKIIKNKEYPFLTATLDGELTEIETKRKGILEIKTTEIMNGNQWYEWVDKIPNNYYTQVLHQLLATGYDFVILKAQIKTQYHDVKIYTKHYVIEKQDVADDMKLLLEKEKTFWQSVMDDKRPNTLLPQI